MIAFTFFVVSAALLVIVLLYDLYDRWTWARLNDRERSRRMLADRIEARRKDREDF